MHPLIERGHWGRAFATLVFTITTLCVLCVVLAR